MIPCNELPWVLLAFAMEAKLLCVVFLRTPHLRIISGHDSDCLSSRASQGVVCNLGPNHAGIQVNIQILLWHFLCCSNSFISGLLLFLETCISMPWKDEHFYHVLPNYCPLGVFFNNQLILLPMLSNWLMLFTLVLRHGMFENPVFVLLIPFCVTFPCNSGSFSFRLDISFL